jgi:hypothetical protein
MILIRIFLIGLIFYLLLDSFAKYGEKSSGEKKKDNSKIIRIPRRKISKSIGEEVDYEEVKNE